jgi:hypothetical protein
MPAVTPTTNGLPDAPEFDFCVMFCLVSGQKVPVIIFTAFGMLDYMMKMPISKNIRISLTPNPIKERIGKNLKIVKFLCVL